MKNQKLFALQGEVRGAAKLVCEGAAGTLAVELSPRPGGEYEAWLVPSSGALLRAPLGPAMSAALPAQAKNAAGVFISRAGKIVASGASGLTRLQMEAAALRVQLALTEAAKAKAAPEARLPEPTVPVGQESAAPVRREVPPPSPEKPIQAQKTQDSAKSREQRNTVPASRAGDTSFSSPAAAMSAKMREERAERLMREALRVPEVKSEAALSIVSMANRLFTPTGRDDGETAYVEKGANTQKPASSTPGYGVRRSVKNMRSPVPPSGRHGAYPPASRAHPGRSRGRSGRPR